MKSAKSFVKHTSTAMKGSGSLLQSIVLSNSSNSALPLSSAWLRPLLSSGKTQIGVQSRASLLSVIWSGCQPRRDPLIALARSGTISFTDLTRSWRALASRLTASSPHSKWTTSAPCLTSRDWTLCRQSVQGSRASTTQWSQGQERVRSGGHTQEQLPPQSPKLQDQVQPWGGERMAMSGEPLKYAGTSLRVPQCAPRPAKAFGLGYTQSPV